MEDYRAFRQFPNSDVESGHFFNIDNLCRVVTLNIYLGITVYLHSASMAIWDIDF